MNTFGFTVNEVVYSNVDLANGINLHTVVNLNMNPKVEKLLLVVEESFNNLDIIEEINLTSEEIVL